MATRLAERLFAKHAELSERWRSAGSQRELTPADVTAQALLSAVAEYAPRIEHLRTTGAHPEALYQTMLGLAGRLSAAVPQAPAGPRDLPAYRHGEASGAFTRLAEIIEQMLGGPRRRRTTPA
jgi:type VI secretion system protein ImpJ